MEFVYDRKHPTGVREELKHFTRDFAHVFVDISGLQHFTDETGTEYPVCTKSLGILMRYAVGKTVREFLRTVIMIPDISQEYSSGTLAWWHLGFGRFSERLSVIANAEWCEYLESSHMIRAV
jgi:hypothetical protein